MCFLGRLIVGDGLLPLHFIRKVLKIQLFFLMRQRFIIWERKLLLKKFKSMPVILMMLQQAELKSSVKKRVEQGIKKNRLDCTAEDIRKLFLIASERYDRPLNQVGIDLFSCNAAINLVNRKMIYCFPWLSQKHFPYCKVKIEKICRVLSDYGKLVLLPVSNQVNGLEKYNIIEFPRPLE